jgi:hypothetical protein
VRLPASAGGSASAHRSGSVGTARGCDALQNFPAPANTYANAWLVVSTGKVFRLRLAGFHPPDVTLHDHAGSLERSPGRASQHSARAHVELRTMPGARHC